jgi:hypothetical protein
MRLGILQYSTHHICSPAKYGRVIRALMCNVCDERSGSRGTSHKSLSPPEPHRNAWNESHGAVSLYLTQYVTMQPNTTVIQYLQLSFLAHQLLNSRCALDTRMGEPHDLSAGAGNINSLAQYWKLALHFTDWATHSGSSCLTGVNMITIIILAYLCTESRVSNWPQTGAVVPWPWWGTSSLAFSSCPAPFQINTRINLTSCNTTYTGDYIYIYIYIYTAASR